MYKINDYFNISVETRYKEISIRLGHVYFPRVAIYYHGNPTYKILGLNSIYIAAGHCDIATT